MFPMKLSNDVNEEARDRMRKREKTKLRREKSKAEAATIAAGLVYTSRYFPPIIVVGDAR